MNKLSREKEKKSKPDDSLESDDSSKNETPVKKTLHKSKTTDPKTLEEPSSPRPPKKQTPKKDESREDKKPNLPEITDPKTREVPSSPRTKIKPSKTPNEYSREEKKSKPEKNSQPNDPKKHDDLSNKKKPKRDVPEQTAVVVKKAKTPTLKLNKVTQGPDEEGEKKKKSPESGRIKSARRPEPTQSGKRTKGQVDRFNTARPENTQPEKEEPLRSQEISRTQRTKRQVDRFNTGKAQPEKGETVGSKTRQDISKNKKSITERKRIKSQEEGKIPKPRNNVKFNVYRGSLDKSLMNLPKFDKDASKKNNRSDEVPFNNSDLTTKIP